MTDPLTCTPADILSFWFAPEVQSKWFARDEVFDTELRQRFGSALVEARRGELDHWAETPDGALTLVILLDQVSRNIHRGTPDAFAADARALATAKAAIERGFDQRLDVTGRKFLYMPFEHAENLVDQDQGVALFEALGEAEALDYMRRHRAIIERFGRFPHRNVILGRVSSEEETEFLRQPGSSF